MCWMTKLKIKGNKKAQSTSTDRMIEMIDKECAAAGEECDVEVMTISTLEKLL